MPNFDFAGLEQFLAEADIEIVVAERDARDRQFEARSLEIDQATLEEFRDEALKYVRTVSHRDLLDHQEATLLAENEASVTERSILDGGLLNTLEQAAHRTPGSQGDPVPNRIRLYALVTVGEGNTAILLRRQNPVRHLRGGITRVLYRSRLDHSRPVFVYDGRFDVFVWNTEVLVASDNALDAIFEDDHLRAEQTEAAISALARNVRRADEAEVRGLEHDTAMAAKIRKMWKAGVFENVDTVQLARVIDEFEVDVEIEGGELVFPLVRRRRWELLALIEDAFVRGAASQRPYRANSKLGWSRRIVTGVRRIDGRVTTLLGRSAWSPLEIEDAADDQLHRKIRYVVRAGDLLVPLVIVPSDVAGQYELSIPGADPAQILEDLAEN